MKHSSNVVLPQHAVRNNGELANPINYESQVRAIKFLQDVLADDRGVGLVLGSEVSGKTNLIQRFVQNLPADLGVAIVDGDGLNTKQLLTKMLAQFGYAIKSSSTDELLNLVSVFVVQQTRSCQSPVLLIENMDELKPGAMSALCKLATLSIHNRFALRIVLVGDRDICQLLKSPAMISIAERMVGYHDLGPLTARETLIYLMAKMRSSGFELPDNVFPVNMCDRLHAMSGGWPGKLDRIASAIIDRHQNIPVLIEEPDFRPSPDDLPRNPEPYVSESTVNHEALRLIVTLDGNTLQEIAVETPKILVGRSVMSEVRIDEEFVSKEHALLIQYEGLILLVDLKSKNGTFVNSCKVQRKLLLNNDIISIGNHRIKVVCPNIRTGAKTDSLDSADTANMASIGDSRRQRARQTLTACVPAANTSGIGVSRD